MAEVPEGFVKAKIDPGWADQISFFDIWTHNRYSAEDVFAEVKLRLLGGLVIDCTERTYIAFEHAQIARSKSTINLAEGFEGRLTSTDLLVEAATEQRGEDDQLTQDLRARQVQTNLHGPNETWVLPKVALEVIEHVEATRTE